MVSWNTSFCICGGERPHDKAPFLIGRLSETVTAFGIIPTTVERTPRAVDSCSGIKFYAILEFPATERSR